MNGMRVELGDVDIYLFDQLLKGRFQPGQRILDAGCGAGRNSRYLLRIGCDAYGVDRSEAAVRAAQSQAAQLSPEQPADRFRVGNLEQLPFEDAFFHAVIVSAVLHFAADEPAFEAMLRETWRVLRPGGLYFVRLASSRGIEQGVQWMGPRVGRIPDGSIRFLVDDAYLAEWEVRLGADRIEPIKTTLVEDRRAMTTWVLGKQG